MKKFLYFTALFSIIIFSESCKKSSTSEPVCNGASDFSIVQQIEALKLTITGSGSPLYYEISVQPAPGTSPENGTRFIINNTSASFSIDSLGLPANQTYICYVRAACSATDLGGWIGPKSITINNFCDKPYSLGFNIYPDGAGFDWQVKNNTNATSFQVQYGLRGFSLGSGTNANVVSSPFTSSALMANTNYDFYVRSSCSGSLGFGNWAGPYSYFSPTNQHLCITPSNVIYQIERNGLGQAVGATFQWEKNGETNFEYTIVLPTQSVNAGTINSIGNSGWPTVVGIFQNTDYHFYVRAVCVSGTRTSWVGPKLFNIGF